MIRIRASSLGEIMTSSRSKDPSELSSGAITHCYELAKQHVYKYTPEIQSKYIDKGHICEDESIKLYNDVCFTSHKKNEERKTNDYLTGECDIDTGSRIIDIKTSWSKQTYPAIPERIGNKLYEWQGRAYMMLWDRDEFELAYCLVSTPGELGMGQDASLHNVDDIPPEMRVVTKIYDRDKSLEDLIEIKCRAAQAKVNKFIGIMEGL